MDDKFMKNYEIALATEDDTEQILQLLKEVASWLEGTGSKQWETVTSGDDDDEIKQAIADKLTFIMKKEELLVATFTLFPTQSDWDEWLWGRTNEPAAYLHKLALKPSEIGTGLGANVLKWLENYLKKNGNNKLRLDCIANNEKLNHFYSKNGFTKIGESKRFSLFEKKLDEEQ